MKKSVYLFFIYIILLASIISATYSTTDYSIDKEYGPKDTLKGWINISLENENSNSIFESSEGDTTTIMTLINGDEDFLYTCNNLKCISDYEASNPETTKTFVLNSGESFITGLKITGNPINDISNFSIDVTSDAGESNSPQLLIDVLNDQGKVWQAHTASGNFGFDKYGCYTIAEGQAEIVQIPYCQKISVPSAPNIKIGGRLVGSGGANFVMSIESIDSSEYGSCLITTHTGFLDDKVSCEPLGFIINKEQEYFVCIKAKTQADEDKKYKINYERIDPCGFSGNFNDDFNFDFEIFAKPGIYGTIGSFTLDSTELSNVKTDIEDYLYSIYENDCSDGCIIPVKITSMFSNQAITLSNVILSYFSGISETTNTLYDLTETPAKVSADMQKLSINSGNFNVPNEYGNHTISLKFNDEEIFSEEIIVEKIPIIKFVEPLTTAAAYPTKFKVSVDSDKQVNLYEWDFGNGDTEITTINEVTYAYDSLGTYNLEVRAIDVDKRSSSKIFTITIGSASIITGTIIQEKKNNLMTIKTQIQDFSKFEQDTLEKVLNIPTVETGLNIAESANAKADTEEDYQAILGDLLEIRIPKMISISAVADSIIFYPEKTNINPGILTEITGESYDNSKEDKYINAILGWGVRNIDMTITYKKITSSFEVYEEPLLRTFEVEMTKKAGSEEDSYIIIKKVEGLTFAEDYSEEEKLGYLYIPLIEESKKIVFATTEDIDFIDLPLFVSPGVSELSLVESDFNLIDDSGKLKKWALFVLIMLLLIIFGIIFWVVLHAWYKKKYEDYLFKNKNNLYNLFTWIKNSKKRGLDEKKIKTQLKHAGWTSEQLEYALKKYSGKRTGMPEIPIGKIIKKSTEKGSIPSGKNQQNPNKKQPKKKFYNTENKR